MLLEMIRVARMTDRKVLYFTDKNLYIGKGSFIKGMGFVTGGLIGHAIEKKLLSDKEKEARKMNFREEAAKDPSIIVIPYLDIIKLNMPKKGMFTAPKIRIETTSKDYEFWVSNIGKYKEHQKSISSILGDKVTVG